DMIEIYDKLFPRIQDDTDINSKNNTIIWYGVDISLSKALIM
ncbi:15461_t:CDS:1, partial [Acaulospora morrowiae]